MKEVLHAICYNTHESEQENLLVQTESLAKTSGTVFPKYMI